LIFGNLKGNSGGRFSSLNSARLIFAKFGVAISRGGAKTPCEIISKAQNEEELE